jgi:hypothetical protein
MTNKRKSEKWKRRMERYKKYSYNKGAQRENLETPYDGSLAKPMRF